jgi:hypothetical protein
MVTYGLWTNKSRENDQMGMLQLMTWRPKKTKDNYNVHDMRGLVKTASSPIHSQTK